MPSSSPTSSTRTGRAGGDLLTPPSTRPVPGYRRWTILAADAETALCHVLAGKVAFREAGTIDRHLRYTSIPTGPADRRVPVGAGLEQELQGQEGGGRQALLATP
jgi:hypothetical protein